MPQTQRPLALRINADAPGVTAEVLVRQETQKQHLREIMKGSIVRKGTALPGTTHVQETIIVISREIQTIRRTTFFRRPNQEPKRPLQKALHPPQKCPHQDEDHRTMYQEAAKDRLSIWKKQVHRIHQNDQADVSGPQKP